MLADEELLQALVGLSPSGVPAWLRLLDAQNSSWGLVLDDLYQEAGHTVSPTAIKERLTAASRQALLGELSTQLTHWDFCRRVRDGLSMLNSWLNGKVIGDLLRA